MSQTTASMPVPTWKEALIEHLNKPLFRNAYALVFNTGATAFLGMLYWMLAADFYDAETLGRNSVAISMMIFLAGLSGLNLQSMLNRFIPRAGHQTKRLIIIPYLLTMIVAAVIATAFLFGQQRLDPERSFLDFAPGFGFVFVAATMIWVIFELQDNVLIGLRQSVWVPIENTLFSIGKIILLVLFVSLLPNFGLFVSWIIPVALSIIPINYLIFRRLVPRHIKENAHRAEPIRTRTLVRYSSSDYFGQVMSLASSQLLPFIIFMQIGAEGAAYFNIAWLIAITPALMGMSMTQSLTVEGANESDKLASYLRDILRQMAKMLLPVVVLLIIFSPLLLSVFGTEYRQNGTVLFILLALSTIPVTFNVVSISIGRVRQQIRHLVAVPTLSCVLSLSSAYIMAGHFGILGVGVAYLGSQIIVALTLAMPLIIRVLKEGKEDAQDELTSLPAAESIA